MGWEPKSKASTSTPWAKDPDEGCSWRILEVD